MVKGKCTMGRKELWEPRQQEKKCFCPAMERPRLLHSDKDLLLQKLFSGIWFRPLDSFCMVMDVFLLNIF
jgi:hypothetical protein